MDPPDTDGWVKLHFLFESEEAACGYLLGFGSRVEVVAFYAQKAEALVMGQDDF